MVSSKSGFLVYTNPSPAQQQLTDQQPDKALASLADSHIMYQLGMNYARSYLSEVTWTKLLEQTEEGQQLFQHFIGLQEQFEHIKGYLNVDFWRAKVTR